MPTTMPTDQEKAAVWKAYEQHHPTRVPVMYCGNPRLVLCNPQWNTEGYTFEQAANDPQIHINVGLKFLLYWHTVLAKYMDHPTAFPEVWGIALHAYNVYEAAYFGATVDYSPNQVPDTTPPFADDDRKHEVFNIDIEKPLENPYIRQNLDFWHQMQCLCKGMTFEGRPVRLGPWVICGTDGPVTVACNLRGAENFMMDLAADPEYADRLLAYIIRAANIRRRAFEQYWHSETGYGNNLV